VTELSLVAVVPNIGKVLILNGAPVVTGFSLVIAVLNECGVLIVVEFSLVIAVGDTIGVMPNTG
jgi:hypothetical protein